MGKIHIFLSLLILFTSIIGYFYIKHQSKVETIIKAFKAVYYLSEDDLKKFMNSYELFKADKVTDDNEKLIIDYYNVLNLLCSLGEIEKMYIPPVIDLNLGVFENQILYEEQIIKHINAKEGKHILDLGCGRGGVSVHISNSSGANVTGLNIDPAQIRAANERKEKFNIKKVNYINRSFNEPLPFGNETFDGAYNIQAFTYIKDYKKVFGEIYRVLKPGASLSILDWFTYNYDEKNSTHVELMSKCKLLIGAVFTAPPEVMVDALKSVGFKVTVNENASIGGKQYQLIESADFYFKTLNFIVNVFVKLRLLPEHMLTLMNRFTQDADSFILGDKLSLWTSCHQIVAVKP